MRLKRSQISAPGYDLGRIERAAFSGADMIMLDLEDNVIPPLKAKARATVAEVLDSFDFRGMVKCVKINGWESGMTVLDLEAVLPARPDEIKLSKCENPDDIRRLDAVISEFERTNGIVPGTVEINAQIESPLGIRNAFEILSASRRVTTASFGHEDLASALGVWRDYAPGSDQAVYMMGKLALDAAAAGVWQVNGTAIVAAPGDFQGEPAYIRSDTANLRSMGFTGRGAVYPEHVAIINEIFTPDPGDVALSHEIVECWNRGMETGDPALFVLKNGLPIDPGRLERAKRTIAFGDAYRDLMRRRGCRDGIGEKG